MTETVAWLTFGVGALTAVAAVVALSTKDREMVPLMVIACSLTALGVVVVLDSEKAKTYSQVFGAGGLLLTALKYVRDRHLEEEKRVSEERAKRHERVMADWRAFVANPLYVRAIYILETDGPELKRLGEAVDFDAYKDWKNPLDQIFEFLQALAFSVACEHVSRTAVSEALGWYYRRIHKLPHVSDYCKRNGYQGITKFGAELDTEDAGK